MASLQKHPFGTFIFKCVGGNIIFLLYKTNHDTFKCAVWRPHGIKMAMWEMEIGNMSVQERKLPMTALHEIFKDFSWCGRTFALGVEWDHGERRDRLLDGMTWQILQSVYVSWSWVQIKMEAKESRHISREDGKAGCIWPTEQWEIRWGEKRWLWRTQRVKGENKGNGGP